MGNVCRDIPIQWHMLEPYGGGIASQHMNLKEAQTRSEQSLLCRILEVLDF